MIKLKESYSQTEIGDSLGYAYHGYFRVKQLFSRNMDLFEKGKDFTYTDSESLIFTKTGFLKIILLSQTRCANNLRKEFVKSFDLSVLTDQI